MLTKHYLLKLQNVYILYGTFGNWFLLVGINSFHTMFDWKRSFSNANSNTSHETSIKLMIHAPITHKLCYYIVMC